MTSSERLKAPSDLCVSARPLSYELIRGPDENQMDAWGPIRHPEFYVWDHVAVALHMENRKVPSLLLLLTISQPAPPARPKLHPPQRER